MAAAVPLLAHAAWPERPIQLIVPVGAGGSPDIISRLVAQELAKRLGQPVVVENRPGAGGNIGTRSIAVAAPDGYVIGYGNNATLSTNPFLYKSLPADPSRLVPVVALASTTNFLVVSSDAPYTTVRQLIQAMKANGHKASFASAGVGSSAHLGAELFKTMTGFEAQHIPYQGSPQATQDLIGGNVQFMFANISSVAPLVKSGKLRALAITSNRRSAQFPDVPTMEEAGVKDFEMTAWGGLVAPPGTPDDIVQRLAKEVNEVLRDPAVRAQLEQISFVPIGGTPAQFQQLITTEKATWRSVIQKSGASID